MHVLWGIKYESNGNPVVWFVEGRMEDNLLSNVGCSNMALLYNFTASDVGGRSFPSTFSENVGHIVDMQETYYFNK